MLLLGALSQSSGLKPLNIEMSRSFDYTSGGMSCSSCKLVRHSQWGQMLAISQSSDPV
ncbi:uncharacterized protein PHALS_08790 [Plasmopara halstedii]|uniref:Uncharacterized protein n=1 Tax=Plasmopara halstedii TaxID=4781 RepID=A0A0P1ACP0_PLAHL|nr:uncharacterized protein PHALS_08790 [Plasmopara halstedii]CEG38733.1 hypothetical protein PHALS_08790 [Plasmopara halstedii]|eukprot:XP_024575102.1 hypothetical protein PHALS_08790 [Plasmopara halstedii]